MAYTNQSIIGAYNQAMAAGKSEGEFVSWANAQGVSNDQLMSARSDMLGAPAPAPAPAPSYTQDQINSAYTAEKKSGASDADLYGLASSQYGVTQDQFNLAKMAYQPSATTSTATAPAAPTYTQGQINSAYSTERNRGSSNQDLYRLASTKFGVTPEQFAVAEKSYATSVPQTTRFSAANFDSARQWANGKTAAEIFAELSRIGATPEEAAQMFGVSTQQLKDMTGYGNGINGFNADGSFKYQPTWENGVMANGTKQSDWSFDSSKGWSLKQASADAGRTPTAQELAADEVNRMSGAYTADGLRNAPQQSAQQPSSVLNSLKKLVEDGRVTGQTDRLYAAMKSENPAYNDLVSWLWRKADPATGMVDLGGGSVLQAFDPAQMNGAQQSAGASSQSYRGMPSTGLNLQQIQQAQQLAVQPNQTVQGQLQQIIATDSPLMQQARARAMQTANARGMLNSSMAASAGESAMYDAAMPIAQQDAGTYADAAKFNVGEQNTFNRDANAFTRDAFMADFNLQANEWAKQQDQYRLYDQMGYQQRLTLDRDAIQNGYTNARDAILNGYTVARDATTNAFTLTRDAAQNTYQTDRDKTLQGYTKENNADQNAFTAGQQTSQNAFTLQRDNNQNAFTAGQQTSQNAFTSGQQAAQNTYSAEQAKEDRIATYQRALLGVNTPATDTSLQRTQLSEAGATERTRLQIEANAAERAAERAANTRLDAQTNLNKITTEWAGKVITINTSDLSQPQKDTALIQYTSTYGPIATSYATQAGLDPTNVGKDLRYVAPAATNVVETVIGNGNSDSLGNLLPTKSK